MTVSTSEQVDALDSEIRELIIERNELSGSEGQKRIDEVIDNYVDDFGHMRGVKIANAILGVM